MTQVVYNGTADFQEFGKADFEKANVDHGKVRFANGEPTEVPDEVAEVLTSKEGIFGDFAFKLVENDADEEDPGDFDEEAETARAQKKAAKKSGRKVENDSGTLQQTDTTTAGGRAAGTSGTGAAGTSRGSAR